MQQFTAKFIAVLANIEAAIVVAAYTLVAAFLLTDVIGRELFNTSIYGAQKISVQATLVAAFLGLSLATGKSSHLRAESMDMLVPQRWSAGADRIGHVVSFVIFAALAVVSAQFVLETYGFGIRIAVLGWPMWPVQLVLPVAFGSSALKSVAFAVFPGLVTHRDIKEFGD